MFNIRQQIPLWKQILLGALGIFAVAVLYWWTSHTTHERNPNDTTVPGFTQIMKGFSKILAENRNQEVEIWGDIRATFTRFFCGMTASGIISILIGVMMGCFTPIDSFFRPLLSCAAKTPPMAMIAVFFVLIGLNEWLFISIVAFGAIPPLTLGISNEAKEVPAELITKGLTQGASRMEVSWSIVFRHVLPQTFAGLILTTGPAINYLVGSEGFFADKGFGYRIRILSRVLEMNQVYIYVLVLIALGYFTDWLFKMAAKKLCPWYEG